MNQQQLLEAQAKVTELSAADDEPIDFVKKIERIECKDDLNASMDEPIDLVVSNFWQSCWNFSKEVKDGATCGGW